jgi:hypothetical protein
MVMEDGHNGFFVFHFLNIKVLVKFDPKIAKFTQIYTSKIPKIPKKINFLCQKMLNFHPKLELTVIHPQKKKKPPPM